MRLYMDLIAAGVGVLSQAPTMAIQRNLDGLWFQASDGTWQPTKVENPTAQLHTTDFPGRYYMDFNQELDLLEGSSEYIVKKSNSGVPVALEYEDLAFGPLAGAAALELCSVQGSIYNGQGQPAANEQVRATLIPIFRDRHARTIRSDHALVTYTNELGDFDLPLARGGTFRLEIVGVGYDKKVCIPDQSSVLFTDL